MRVLSLAACLTACADERGNEPASDTPSPPEQSLEQNPSLDLGTGVEACDGEDNNADGIIDENGGGHGGWYDGDGDGYGDPDRWLPDACLGPQVADNGDDCNDSQARVNPGAAEECGGLDLNCDGETIPPDATWVDRDGDGWYREMGSCQNDGLTYYELYLLDEDVPVDCDDSEARAYPGAHEVCGDGMVFDCDFYTSDPDCLEPADCPDFWPLESLAGQQVSLLQYTSHWLYWESGPALGERLGAQSYSWTSTAIRNSTTHDGFCDIKQHKEEWGLACTSAGIVRVSLNTREYYNSGGWSSEELGSEIFRHPPLALPRILEVGTQWEEEDVRHARRDSDVFGLSTRVNRFKTQHRVTECAVEAVPPTGNRTVCTVSSEDDDGESWTWQVAEGLGPIDIDGPDRVWIEQL